VLDTKKHQELELVELMEDMPEYDLKKGDIGVVVEVFDKPDEAYDLEFVDESGMSSRFAYSVKPSQVRSAEETAKEALERGIALHNNGRGVEAEKEFRRATELKPSLTGELHNLFVRSFELQGNFEKEEVFESFIFAMRLILRLNPEYEVARNNLAIAFENHGIIEANKGNLLGAITKLRIALAIAVSPEIVSYIRHNLATVWTQLGIQAYQRGEFEGLPNFMGQAYEANPTEETKHNLGMAYAYLALSCLGQNNLEGARWLLQLAWDITATLPENYGLLISDADILEKSILQFLKRSAFSVESHNHQPEFWTTQMQSQEYKTAA
jgi:tetratricopeptide (TPR) repeat protein